MPENDITTEYSVGNRLKEFLAEKFPELSERARSGALDIPNSTVRGWIEGRDISAAGLSALAKAGCNLNWLITGEKTNKETKKSPPKAGTKEAADMAELSLMAVEVQEELNDIHRRALQGDLTAAEFKAILLAITASVAEATRSKKSAPKKSTA